MVFLGQLEDTEKLEHLLTHACPGHTVLGKGVATASAQTVEQQMYGRTWLLRRAHARAGTAILGIINTESVSQKALGTPLDLSSVFFCEGMRGRVQRGNA